jgi:hypothetical protein
MRRLAADFVERNKPVVDVKRCVLDPLGGDGRRDLLELPGEFPLRLARAGLGSEEQGVADEIEDRAIRLRISRNRLLDRTVDDLHIRIAYALVVDIRPVDREACDDLAQCVTQCVVREVARAPARAARCGRADRRASAARWPARCRA